VKVGVEVMVPVTISGVGLRVGDIVIAVRVVVGVARVSGAREMAIKPTQ
jgi:hypothetical protein